MGEKLVVLEILRRVMIFIRDIVSFVFTLYLLFFEYVVYSFVVVIS